MIDRSISLVTTQQMPPHLHHGFINPFTRSCSAASLSTKATVEVILADLSELVARVKGGHLEDGSCIIWQHRSQPFESSQGIF